MIDFRYHLVSLVAVFLALTVGLVLGTTMLQDPLLDRLNEDAAQLRDEAEQLRADKEVTEQRYAGATALVAAWSDDMVADQLDGMRVVILEAPGVDETARDTLADQVTAGGATMTGRVAFTERYLEPGAEPAVRDLTDDLTDGLAGDLAADDELPTGGAYERAAALLAPLVLTTPDGGAERSDRDAVLDEFHDAGFLTSGGQPTQGADLALILAPEGMGTPTNDQTGYAPMLSLAEAAAETGDGVVIAGAPDAAIETGLVGHARAAGDEFSTVDVAGDTAGNIVTVYALAGAAHGDIGHYGIGPGSDDYLPDPLPPSPDRDEEEDTE